MGRCWKMQIGNLRSPLGDRAGTQILDRLRLWSGEDEEAGGWEGWNSCSEEKSLTASILQQNCRVIWPTNIPVPTPVEQMGAKYPAVQKRQWIDCIPLETEERMPFWKGKEDKTPFHSLLLKFLPSLLIHAKHLAKYLALHRCQFQFLSLSLFSCHLVNT